MEKCVPKNLLALVIDDDHDTQEEMCDMLREYGITRLLCSDDPVASLQLIEEHSNGDQIDLVIANVELGSIRAIDLIREIKIVKPDTIVIMYSSCEDPTTHARAWAIGSSDYFRKEPGYRKKIVGKMTAWISIASMSCKLHEDNGKCNLKTSNGETDAQW